MNPEQLLLVFLIIISVYFVLERVLEYFNLRSLRSDIPDEVAGFYDAARYRESIDYARTNLKFGLITSSLSFALVFVLLAGGGSENSTPGSAVSAWVKPGPPCRFSEYSFSPPTCCNCPSRSTILS
jgi:hypothetical protein